MDVPLLDLKAQYATIKDEVLAAVSEAYLVRRLLENGANSSFVHQLADPQSVGCDALLASPLQPRRRPASRRLARCLVRRAAKRPAGPERRRHARATAGRVGTTQVPGGAGV